MSSGSFFNDRVMYVKNHCLSSFFEVRHVNHMSTIIKKIIQFNDKTKCKNRLDHFDFVKCISMNVLHNISKFRTFKY